MTDIRPLILSPRFDAMPLELTARAQWVVWRAVWLPAKSKYNKVPVDARTGANASSTDPATWCDFATARAAYEGSPGAFGGVGFVLSPDDPFCGVDLDHVVIGRVVSDAATVVVAALDTYAEVSPSGTGVRLFAVGTLPPGGRKKGDTECYESGRFLTVTGRKLPAAPASVNERQAQLEAFHAKHFPAEPKPEREKRGDTLPPNLSDTDLLAKATSAANGAKVAALYAGSTAGYAGASEADLALCSLLAFYTGDDPARLDALFRGSALMRDKWDERHYAGGETYGAHTLRKAIDGCPTFHHADNKKNNVRECMGQTTDKTDKTTNSPVFDVAPGSLDVALLPVPTLTPDMLPDALRPWLCDAAERTSVPLEYVAAPALVALASVLGRKLALRPKRCDSWAVVPVLWGACVGRPGTLKTPATAEGLRPLHRLEVTARSAFDAEQNEFALLADVREAQKDAVRGKLKAAAKKNVSKEELVTIARDGEAGTDTAPVCRRFVVNDTTVEKLGELLKENPNGLMLFRDELTGFFKSLDKQGHESDRGFYLQAWNGTGAYTYDRIGRGTVVIPAPCVSLFGTIQPGPLARYLRSAASGEDADGLASRLQLLIYPDPVARFVNVDRYPNGDAKNRAFALYERLADLNSATVGAETGDEGELPFLHFTPDAQGVFDAWREHLENHLTHGNETPLLQMHLSKYRSLCPCLALLFHLADSAEGAVSVAALDRAIRWCDFLLAHARRVYQCAMDGDSDLAAGLAARIKASLPNPFTVRDVERKGWGGLDSKETITKAVDILEDRGWVKVVERKPEGGGRPSVEVWINPAIRETVGEI